MKTLLNLIAPAIVATSQAMGASALSSVQQAEVLRCHTISGFHPPEIEVLNPAQCTCDGLQYINVGGVTLTDGNPRAGGGNGGLDIDCFRHTLLTPGFYLTQPNGPLNLVATAEPVIVEIRGCDTSDCYWLFGSASCVIESTHTGGHVVSYQVIGACSEAVDTPDPATPPATPPAPGDPGTGDPGTGDPGTGDPGTGDPGTGDPGTGDPGTGDPGTGDPGTGDPGTGDPGTGDPGTGDPGTGDPGTGDPGTGDPGTGDPGTGDPGDSGGE